jgi:hypothetical protein
VIYYPECFFCRIAHLFQFNAAVPPAQVAGKPLPFRFRSKFNDHRRLGEQFHGFKESGMSEKAAPG